MTDNLPDNLPQSQVLFYQGEDGVGRIEVRLEGGTVWLNQGHLAELYQTTVPNVSTHIKNIYDEDELDEKATVKEYLIVREEGDRRVRRKVRFYNLDLILAIGYRVHSHRGTQFRRWATENLRQYLIKGFVMDDQRLKDGRNIGADYFDELLERIRDIRASEKRFYQKIRDIYKLSIDYDSKAEATKEFFKIVQNKLHWAITGRTAAELIVDRVDASKPNMGLTSWKGAKVRKTDVTVGKNYLQQEELRQLNTIVTMYLDYAELQASRRKPLYMKDWREKLDGFLQFNERDILDHPGQVPKEVADRLALDQYEQFNQRRLAEEAAAPDPDFDEMARTIENKRKEDKPQ